MAAAAARWPRARPPRGVRRRWRRAPRRRRRRGCRRHRQDRVHGRPDRGELRHRHPAAATARSWRSTSTTRPTRRTKIELVEYDSQGSAGPGHGAGPAGHQHDKIVGLIGPAFSGESKAGRPDPRGGQDPEHLPVGDQPRPGRERLEVLAPRRGQRRPIQGPGIARLHRPGEGPKKAFVISDDQEYSSRPRRRRDQRPSRPRASRVERDQFDPGGLDYSSTGQQGQGGQAGRDLLRRLLRRRPAGCSSSCATAGVTATFASGDGSLDAGLITGCRCAPRRGRDPRLPVHASTRRRDRRGAEEVRRRVQGEVQRRPGDLLDRGLRRRDRFIEAIKAGNTDPGEDQRASSRRSTSDGRLEADQVRAERRAGRQRRSSSTRSRAARSTLLGNVDRGQAGLTAR